MLSTSDSEQDNRPQRGLGRALMLPFYREGRGCPGTTGKKRQRGVVEGLAQVAERMSHMGTRTEGSGLPIQCCLLHPCCPCWRDWGQVMVKESHCPGRRALVRSLGYKSTCEDTEVGALGSLDFHKR